MYDLFELFDLDKNKVIDREDFNVGMKTLESGIDDEQILKMIEFVGQDSLTLRDFRKCVMER